MPIWSAVLLTSTLISALVYQDQSFFWNILMNDHMGWSYVGIHLFTSFYLAARIFPTLRNRTRIPHHPPSGPAPIRDPKSLSSK